jgi:hypothetical protein
MAETKTYMIELPKEFVHRMLPLKPKWMPELSEEAFLTLVIARGDYDAYCEEIKKADGAFKEINERLGISCKTAKEEIRKRTMPGKTPAPAGPDKPSAELPNKALKTPATT